VHKAAFDNKGLAECITCHNNHEIASPTDALLGTAEGSVCIRCHNQGDKGFIAAGEIRSGIDGLLGHIHKSDEILDRAERAGMEVSKPKFELREAIDGVTHARVLIHTSSPAEVNKVISPAVDVAGKTYQAGLDALAELNYRRKGLAVSLFFILFLAVLVYLKLREIERRQPA
jgi:predicted CXXCH cytochrome family protein